jgi:hypothetical protein
VAPPPQPTVDPIAARKPIDAAATAEFVYGHPAAVGSGTRVPTKRVASETDDEAAEDETPPEEA